MQWAPWGSKLPGSLPPRVCSGSPSTGPRVGPAHQALQKPEEAEEQGGCGQTCSPDQVQFLGVLHVGHCHIGSLKLDTVRVLAAHILVQTVDTGEACNATCPAPTERRLLASYQHTAAWDQVVSPDGCLAVSFLGLSRLFPNSFHAPTRHFPGCSALSLPLQPRPLPTLAQVSAHGLAGVLGNGGRQVTLKQKTGGCLAKLQGRCEGPRPLRPLGGPRGLLGTRFWHRPHRLGFFRSLLRTDGVHPAHHLHIPTARVSCGPPGTEGVGAFSSRR